MVAMRKDIAGDYHENEPLRGEYFRVLGRQRFTSNGFPIEVPVIEPVK